MLLNLDRQLTGLDRQPIEGEENHLAKLLAHRIYMSNDEFKEPVKFRTIAEKLYNEGAVEIDDTDIKKLHSFIESGKANVVLGAKAEYLRIIDEVRLNDINKNK